MLMCDVCNHFVKQNSDSVYFSLICHFNYCISDVINGACVKHRGLKKDAVLTLFSEEIYICLIFEIFFYKCLLMPIT